MKLWVVWFLIAVRVAAGTFTVATYNLEFYVDRPVLGHQAKGEQAKRAVRAAIRAINADVIALQEMGSTNALLELRSSLKAERLDYPYWEHVQAFDEDLHVAFLSKLPIVAQRHRTNEAYLLGGRRFRVARGFGEIEVEFKDGRRITLITAHLKSKRASAEANQQEMREEEALLLRERVDNYLQRKPDGHLIVLGDLNDGVASRSTRTVLGRGKTRLFDTRPREMAGAARARAIVWTHFFAPEESYTRIDYILTSPAMRRLFRVEKSGVLMRPDWGEASDHRPVFAGFELE